MYLNLDNRLTLSLNFSCLIRCSLIWSFSILDDRCIFGFLSLFVGAIRETENQLIDFYHYLR